jgi:hypothetical protein
VTVTFEPEGVSSVSDLLTITAGAFGEYQCNLKGNAKPPLPQVRPPPTARLWLPCCMKEWA